MIQHILNIKQNDPQNFWTYLKTKNKEPTNL